MKHLGLFKIWSVVCAFLFGGVVCQSVLAAAPFDNFENTLLDSTKWRHLEKGTYVENGKLELEYRTSGVDYDFIDIKPVNPDTIYGLRAKMQIKSASTTYLSSGDLFQVGIFGSFYTTNQSPYGNGAIVYAGAYIEAYNAALTPHVIYFVSVQQGDTWYNVDIGAAPLHTVAYDSEATLTLEWDGGVTFRVRIDTDNDGTAEAFEPFDGPSNDGTLTGSEKALELVIDNGANPSTGDKYAFASIDDVEIQSVAGGAWTPYDTFTGTRIDSTKWIQEQDPPKNFTRHGVENGQMFFTAQADGTVNHWRTRIDNRLPESQYTDYFQADITFDPSTSVSGVDSQMLDNEARVWFAGFVFNDTYNGSYNGDEGAVFPSIIVKQLDDGTARAYASNWRCGDANCTTGTDQFFSEFDCDVIPGLANTISIARSGSSFTYTCDNSVRTYTFSDMYANNYDFRMIRVDARASNGESTDVKVYVDNVYTAKPTTFEYFGINHSIYEDGRDVYRISFNLNDENGNNYTQDIVNSLQLSDGSTTYNTDDVTFHKGNEIYGIYNGTTGDIDYDPVYIYTEYYGPVVGALANGGYQLTANVTPPGTGAESIQISKQWNYTPEVLPMVSATSFEFSNDTEGNLIFNWDAPTGINSTTNSRISIEAYSNDSFLGDIYVRVPTDLGQITVPAHIVQEVEGWGGNRYEVMVNIRTNDGTERTYSNRKLLRYLSKVNSTGFPWAEFLPAILINSQK